MSAATRSRPMRRFWRHAGGMLVLLLPLACAPRPPAPPANAAASPAALLERIRRREERITSLRARFDADSERAGETRHTDGVLLVKKPDRFRLRLILPLGLTVFDYVSWGAHTQVSLPLENRTLSDGAPDERLAFSHTDLRAAFLRGADAFPGSCRTEAAPGSVVAQCRDAAGQVLRRIRIDAQRGTIRDETSYEEGAVRMIIRYDDYRRVDAVDLPYHIVLAYPAQRVTLSITIQRYEVNPPLADELFRPRVPWAGS